MMYSFFVTLILQYSGLGTTEKPAGIAFYYILWVIMALLGSLLEVGLIRYVYILSRKEAETRPALFYAFGKQPDTFILVYACRYLLALVWFVPAILEIRKLPINPEPLALIKALLPVCLLILAGIVLGGFIGSLTANVSGLDWLNYGQSFGLENPIVA